MIRVVFIRLAWTVPILLGVSIVAFALMRALPGDFAQAAAGTTAVTAEILETVRRDLGLDKPVWEQYLRWIGDAVTGDLGTSFVTHRAVARELLPRLAVTAELTLIAGAMAMFLGAFSVAPGEILEIKNTIRGLSAAEASSLAAQALALGSVTEIEALLEHRKNRTPRPITFE